MKVIIIGINGRMGHALIDEFIKNGDEIVCGIDRNYSSINSIPVYDSFDSIKDSADIIIDFSHPSLTEKLVDFAVKNNIPVLICTTGHTEFQLKYIEKASEKIYIELCPNTLYGMEVFKQLCNNADKALGNTFDTEMIEMHHKYKKDKVSGTALNLEKCFQNPINIHSLRAGGIIVKHEVIFASDYEVITLSHTALNREAFAAGAVIKAHKIYAEITSKKKSYKLTLPSHHSQR